MSKHVIYVPGLGDHHSYGQKTALHLWRLFGLRPHYFALGWNHKEGLEAKIERLVHEIEILQLKGYDVSLVGVSAGASAVINTFARHRKLTSVVLISGKINHPETIGLKFYRENPDFEESMLMVKSSLDKLAETEIKSIMSIHPWHDQTVPIADTVISGATEKTLPGWSHITGIFFGVIFGSYSIARFIKQADKK